MVPPPTMTSATTFQIIKIARLIWFRFALSSITIATPLIAHAIPSNMGTFTLTSSNPSNDGSASGKYKTAAGAEGTFKIVRNEFRGYNNNVEFTVGSNGIMIKNLSNTANDRDKFSYTIAITPADKNAIHTIKVGQTSYITGGNSEVARQTLNFTPNDESFPTKATVLENPNVSYYFGAMGDYFMGQRLRGNSFSSNNPTSAPQLRVNDSSNLYYYEIPRLSGSGNSSPFTPSLTNREVSFAAGQKRGTLPDLATFENILKSTSTNPNNQRTYMPLGRDSSISNGGSYVSYGISNNDSDYVIAVENAKTVTLTYKGIMRGNSGIEADVIGETFNEWISFGVESTPLYVFSGVVFNDNGGITDLQADANNANIDTGPYDNLNYFNGKFEKDIETKIANSTVSLADKCENPNTIYATQNLADTGEYTFRVVPSILNNQSTVCIIETNTRDSHPIRTTSNSKLITLTNDNYAYSYDFGRVIDKNVALVLEKEQAANNCQFTDFDSLTYSKNPLSSSATGLGADVRPGQCIAYKITATNRSNMVITDFIMEDELQKKDPNDPTSPKVTSLLANPPRADGVFSDGLSRGQNGTVTTISATLPGRSKRSFYFNTQYGSTQSN